MAYISYFFGGAFLVNAVPHFVCGMMGKKFPTPFAKPPGKGLSSAVVNFLWGFFNFIVAYALIYKVGEFNIHELSYVSCVALGGPLLGLRMSDHFSKQIAK